MGGFRESTAIRASRSPVAFERFHRWFSTEVKLHLIVYTVGDPEDSPEDTNEDPATDDTTVAQLPEEASVVTHNK
ncbi:MAG TPA: hypothetical protein VF444_18180 [Pseudonocardiaceae bacterium]